MPNKLSIGFVCAMPFFHDTWYNDRQHQKYQRLSFSYNGGIFARFSVGGKHRQSSIFDKSWARFCIA